MQKVEKTRVIQVDRRKPVELFPCNILGVRMTNTQVKDDGPSAELERIDLDKDVRLEAFDHLKTDSMKDHLRVLGERRYIALNPRHADYLYKHPEDYPDAWKGSIGNKIYVGFPGSVVYDASSSEPLVITLWWNGFGVSRTYAHRAGEGRQSKYFFAVFEGNPFAAKA